MIKYFSFLLSLIHFMNKPNQLVSLPDHFYNLTNGLFKPIEIQVLNRSLHKLVGVPYGDTPLPFQKPTRSKTNFNNPKLANKWGPLCVHPFIFQNSFYGNFKIPHDYEMDLNCLTINLYIPLNNQSKPNNLTAMFFIHGGSNAAGGSSYMDGSGLASIGNVIVAMPNYRLDVLGFFNKYNSSFKGNYGLWDQITALKWLYDNCEAIGCNPNSITVFGHSAGSGDTMLLALSQHAQPYINRIIMQSGSGLAHWSYVYETHVIEKIIDYQKTNQSYQRTNLIDLINFKNSKYINSLNDTINNFITVTACNLTHKHICIKQKLKHFFKLISSPNFNQLTQTEIKYAHFVQKLVNSLDFYEFLNLIGYLQKILLEKFSHDFMQNTLYSPDGHKFNEEIEILTKNETSSISDDLFTSFMKRNNTDKKFDLNSINKTNANMSSCYADLALIIQTTDNLIIACDFLKDYSNNYSLLFESKTIKYFLECFNYYYKNKSLNEIKSDLIDDLLIFKPDLSLNEIVKCVEQASIITSNLAQNQSSLYEVITLNNTLKELSFLTENSNYIHRPTFDQEFMKKPPHFEINENEFFNKKIDILIGVTSHESFYFLLHEYNINEILIQTFIYSSMINLTDNLVNKLIKINTNKDLNYCLKRSLLNYYNMNMSDAELFNNSLKNRYESLDLISDFDFVLPVVTQLKAYLKMNHLNKNKNKKSLFAYEYSHLSSFNYLLDHMKSFYTDYENALKKLNHSVTPHFSELDFVFGLPMLSKSGLIKPKNEGLLLYNYTQTEYDFSHLIINYWSNFAKYGDPNSNLTNEMSYSKWNKFNDTNPNIFNLNSLKQKPNANLFNKWLKKHEFWYEILPNKIYNQCLVKNDHELTQDLDYIDKKISINLNKINNGSSLIKINFLLYFILLFFIL